MKKYVCSICGYIYDEASGLPDENMPPGTTWEDVPSSFTCPLCGASKAEFNEKEEQSTRPEALKTSNNSASLPETIDYTAAELSALFSNLAKGCEKQYDPEMAALYNQLADYYQLNSEKPGNPDIDSLKALLETDLSTHFTVANEVAEKNHDRGALRALKWAQQVSRMISSHLKKVKEDKNVYVCDICGFIYVGDERPEICPVCKVPSKKMTQVRRSA